MTTPQKETQTTAERRVEWEERPDGIWIRVPPPGNAERLYIFIVGLGGILLFVELMLPRRFAWGHMALEVVLVLVVAILGLRYMPFFANSSLLGFMGNRTRSGAPIVIELRGGRVFIYDPVAASGAGGAPVVIEDVTDVGVGVAPWPVSGSQRGELRFIRRDNTICDALAGHEVGELEEICRLLKPRLEGPASEGGVTAATGSAADSESAQTPRGALGIEFVEDNRGFTVHLVAPLDKTPPAPVIRWLWRLIPFCFVGSVLTIVIAAVLKKPRVGKFAFVFYQAGFGAAVLNIVNAFNSNRIRRQSLGAEPLDPIALEVRDGMLKIVRTQRSGANLKFAVKTIAQVRAYRRTGISKDYGSEPLATLEIVLRNGVRMDVASYPDLHQLEELAKELNRRLGILAQAGQVG